MIGVFVTFVRVVYGRMIYMSLSGGIRVVAVVVPVIMSRRKRVNSDSSISARESTRSWVISAGSARPVFILQIVMLGLFLICKNMLYRVK